MKVTKYKGQFFKFITIDLFSPFRALWLRRSYLYTEKPKYFLAFLSFQGTLASPKLLAVGKAKYFLAFLSFQGTLASPKLLVYGKAKILFGFSLVSGHFGFAEVTFWGDLLSVGTPL